MGNSRSSGENNKTWEGYSPDKVSADNNNEKRELIMSTVRPSVASNDTNSNTQRSSKEMMTKQEILAYQLN